MKIHGSFALAALAICLSAAEARAQFTTVVQPPPARKTAVPVTVAKDSAGVDTTVVNRLADMTAWVDSAAVAIGAGKVDSVDSARATPADTTGGPTVDSAAVPRRGASQDEPAFSNGAPAPDTATMLPLLALAGVGALGVGLIFLRR
jgi:hypothetical protein